MRNLDASNLMFPKRRDHVRSKNRKLGRVFRMKGKTNNSAAKAEGKNF